MNHAHSRIAFVSLLCATVFAVPAAAQSLPWHQFLDDPVISDSVSEVVNGANVELVVLESTGQLAIVSGPDLILEDTFVDLEEFFLTGIATVFFEGSEFGVIAFQDDGDGFRTLWWVSATGRVIDLDESSGFPLPFVSTELPTDFLDVPIDACDFWDVPIAACDSFDVNAAPLTNLVINLCGLGGASGLTLTLMGLTLVRATRRRRGSPKFAPQPRNR